ncbi:MAG: DUF1990 domain-containing protein [Candidatus Obscuribacterales bacterium]|nr:DUF1990 domain-containing protein [Candidatus Obscuribacterales bacterium]
MISLGKPSPHVVTEYLSTKLNQEFSYNEVGMTKHPRMASPGYTTDHYRIQLGEGSHVFDEAHRALKNWQHFNLGWLNVSSTEIPIESGAVVGLLTSYAAIWLLFACRIVYVVNEDGATQKYGFAYGTLPEHPECGEERFTVEWNTSDNSVWYEILAFSHPACLPTRIAYPLTRTIQKRFAKDSQRAMLAATTANPSA